MLEIEDLHAHYGLSHILQGMSLQVVGGEVLGIFGRNGVGKTTLIKCVAGWLHGTSGDIRFDGTSIGRASPENLCRRGIRLVPEDRRIFPGLSVEENLTLGYSQVAGQSALEQRRDLDAIYDKFPRLADRRKQNGTSLSGGEQQMLAMARILFGKPRLVLIDEPSEGLAPMIVQKVFEVIADLRASGAAILLIEQNLEAGFAACDRYAIVERGRISATGPAQKDHLERVSKLIGV
jgi:branched-chain amino acid transport system ATP-binding protein